MAKKKMSMTQFEKSAADKRADKSGRHGPEGSPKDRAADSKALKAINSKRK
tara:strand:+ start:1025 stop:1177 length:153 start_codon:yes stop_codon:yes gene_type:complete